VAGGHAATHQEVTLGVRYRTPDEQAFSWNQELGGTTQLSPRIYAGECQIVSGLINFDDVSYDDQAELLYQLAAQEVAHFKSYLREEEVNEVLRSYQQRIAEFVHAQMQAHYVETATDYEVTISKGFTGLKASAYTAQEPTVD